MIISHDGQDYDVTNWDEFKHDLLTAIGFQVESAILEEVNRQGLVSRGTFKQSIQTYVEGDELIIMSDAPHAPFLEYGTAGTRKGVTDPFGESSRGLNPSRKMPLRKTGDDFSLVTGLEAWAKQKGIPEKSWFALAKHIQMYGMEAHAPFRKVLYNTQKMSQIINKAVKVASE